jgi:hypothetical protein
MERDTEVQVKVGGYIFIDSTESDQPYVQVPVRIIKDQRLSSGARMLYGILKWCGWRQQWRNEPGYQGQQALADEFAMSVRTVRRHLEELREFGYLETERVGLGQPDNLVIKPPQ